MDAKMRTVLLLPGFEEHVTFHLNLVEDEMKETLVVLCGPFDRHCGLIELGLSLGSEMHVSGCVRRPSVEVMQLTE